jgi:hypothetical protein
MPPLPAEPVHMSPSFGVAAGASAFQSPARCTRQRNTRVKCEIGVKLAAPVALALARSSAGTWSGRRRLAVSDSQCGVSELLGERGRLLSVTAQPS